MVSKQLAALSKRGGTAGITLEANSVLAPFVTKEKKKKKDSKSSTHLKNKKPKSTLLTTVASQAKKSSKYVGC